ncbi:1304_t:CDS:2 [Funneliformis geosporum]|uniref:1304_t:CDS:1 n=1 Tax=Funneliformis geosporum TaxID=1117311 RepID=A0A9W4WL01_9GLOM|nr:1304_t:CDS:2 [Funneliformis geosporum]
MVSEAQQILDKAAQKKIIHKNKAARKKSQLQRNLNKLKQAEGAQNFFTVILSLLFITFNHWDWFSPKKKPQIVPFIIGSFQAFHEKATGDGSLEGFARVYQEMINSSGAIKSFMEAINKANYSLFH